MPPRNHGRLKELRVLGDRRVQLVTAVTLLLLLFGIGGTVGNLIGGRLTDRSVLGAISLSVAALAVSPLNTRLLNVASQQARTLAPTVQSSAFNLGTALGGWLGGGVIAAGAGLGLLPVVGGLVAVVSLVLALGEAQGERRRAGQPEQLTDRPAAEPVERPSQTSYLISSGRPQVARSDRTKERNSMRIDDLVRVRTQLLVRVGELRERPGASERRVCPQRLAEGAAGRMGQPSFAA